MNQKTSERASAATRKEEGEGTEKGEGREGEEKYKSFWKKVGNI